MKRNRKEIDLRGLEVTTSEVAYDGTRLKKGVYGIVSRDTPFIYRNVIDRKTKEVKPRYVNDMEVLTNRSKQDIIAFFANKKNGKRRNCYLADKSVIEEYKPKEKKNNNKQEVIKDVKHKRNKSVKNARKYKKNGGNNERRRFGF